MELDWSEAKWRGIWKGDPALKQEVSSLLVGRKPVRTQEETGDFDVAEFFRLSVLAQQEWAKKGKKGRVKVDIDTDVPIGLVITSDWHVGGPGTEHLLIESDNRKIADHPLLYAYVGGDWANNFVIPALEHAGREDTFAPGMQQYEIVKYLLSILEDSIIAIGDGNHTDWTKRMSGIDPEMIALGDLAYLHTANGSVLDLCVGKQSYKIFRRHRNRWSSMFNPAHAVVTEYYRGPHEFDIGIIEHQHQPHYAMFDGKYREDGSTNRIAVRPGTYKTIDKHAMVNGYEYGSSELVVVILHPDRLHMQPVYGLDNAIEYLSAWV